MSTADITAIVVAALAMLAAIFVMVRHGATLTNDQDGSWREKFLELEAAHSYLLRSVRDMEIRHEEEQARLQKRLEALAEHVDEMVVARNLARLEAAQMAAEIDALRKVLAGRET